MIRFFITSIILLALTSCGTDFSSKADNTSKHDSIEKTNLTSDTTLIKNWLTKVIIGYLTDDDLKAAYNNMRAALTDEYYNYKQDAINLEYGEEMTEEEFHQKWKSKFDTRYVGKGGFFTSPQDNGPIEIPTCTLIKSFGDTTHIFHVVIRDLRWETNYTRDITIVSKHHKLLIADIKEYE